MFPSQNTNAKVKLVAIAKDEAAYLPDWLFHHLYFGFDKIDIYVNNTTDNTLDLFNKLQEFEQIALLDGDPFFNSQTEAPQAEIYKTALIESQEQGFTHVMFLDIDEFWVPKDFTSTIHDCLQLINSDIVCFEWLMKMNENSWFLPPFSDSISGHKALSVKSIIKSILKPKAITPHCVYVPNSTYKLADGRNFKISLNNFSKVPKEELGLPVKDFFVMHRAYRSQPEYIALLKRGRPIGNQTEKSIFKDNRWGFYKKQKEITIKLPTDQYEKYDIQRIKFLQNYALEDEIKKARRFIRRNRQHVVRMIRKARPHEASVLQRILTNITLKDVQEAYNEFKKKNQ